MLACWWLVSSLVSWMVGLYLDCWLTQRCLQNSTFSNFEECHKYCCNIRTVVVLCVKKMFVNVPTRLVCRIQMDIKDRERARKKMGPITVVR